jgi:glycopeptide antibiotics resistance protein
MSVIVVIALGIELGQVRLPGKHPDTTDWFLESLGGILGYVLFRMVRSKLKPVPRENYSFHGIARERVDSGHKRRRT